MEASPIVVNRKLSEDLLTPAPVLGESVTSARYVVFAASPGHSYAWPGTTSILRQLGAFMRFKTAFIVDELKPVMSGTRILTAIEVVDGVCCSKVGAEETGTTIAVDGTEILAADVVEPILFVIITTQVR